MGEEQEQAGNEEWPQKHSGKKTRQRLLDAGLELFAHNGINGTTVADLEREAGLKPGSGTFYRHFRNKDELFEKLIDDGIKALRSGRHDPFDILNASLGDTRADLIIKLRMKVKNMSRMRKFIEILIRDERQFSPERLAELYELLVALPNQRDAKELEVLMSDGKIINCDPNTFSMILNSALIGYHVIRRYFGVDELDGVSSEDMTAALADLIVKSPNSP